MAQPVSIMRRNRFILIVLILFFTTLSQAQKRHPSGLNLKGADEELWNFGIMPYYHSFGLNYELTDNKLNEFKMKNDVTVNDNLKVNTNLTVDGNTQLGNANTDTATSTAKFVTQNGLVLTSLNVATANTLAGLGVIDEGSIIYCTDGDSGSKCIAIYDGSNWKRISLGANISSS